MDKEARRVITDLSGFLNKYGMLKKILFLNLVFCLLTPVVSRSNDNENYRIFHIERSKNRNIVCYDVKTDESGMLDATQPISVYWINNEDRPGEQKGLSYIQQKLAFGYKTISKSSDFVVIALNACSDRPIKITKEGNIYKGHTTINQQDATLQLVYVKTQQNNSLKVEYIELRGFDANGNSVTERIYNK